MCSLVLRQGTEVTVLIYAGRFDPCTHTKGTANTLAGKETDRKTERVKMYHQSSWHECCRSHFRGTVQNEVIRNCQLTLTDSLMLLMNNKRMNK